MQKESSFLVYTYISVHRHVYDTRLTRTRIRKQASSCFECVQNTGCWIHTREKNTHTYMSIAHPRDPVPPIEVRDDGARLSADQSWSKLSLWCFAGLVFNYVWDRYSGLRGLVASLFHSTLAISPFRFSSAFLIFASQLVTLPNL